MTKEEKIIEAMDTIMMEISGQTLTGLLDKTGSVPEPVMKQMCAEISAMIEQSFKLMESKLKEFAADPKKYASADLINSLGL